MPVLDFASAPKAVRLWLDRVVPLINAELDRRLSASTDGPGAQRLLEAMRYAALAPGKRLRPALTLACCDAVGGDRADALAGAAAIELLHCYTLVHDDLPAMDDDDERRGRPTVHIQYDEATAVLAGDALLTASIACAAQMTAGIRAVATLCRRAGHLELLAGQMDDLTQQASQEATIELDAIERLHRAKTGALFAAAAELGALAGTGSETERSMLAHYGLHLGVAFQHADDEDDDDCPLGIVTSRDRRRYWSRRAHETLAPLGESAQMLRQLAQWIETANA